MISNYLTNHKKSMYRNQTVFILLIVILAACSGGEEIEIPEEIASIENLTVYELPENPPSEINFIPEVSFGDTDELIIGGVGGATADERGRVFIADRDQNTIHAFDADGNYLQSLGKEGKGPGEFGSLAFLQLSDDFLHAMDFSQRRVNVFSLETLEFSHTFSLMNEERQIEELTGRFPGSYLPLDKNRYLVSFSQPFRSGDLEDERSVLYYILDSEGKVISDRILKTKMGEFLMERSGDSFMVWVSPFGANSLVELSENGTIFTAWSRDFLIHKYNTDGEKSGANYYPFQNAPLDRDEAINYNEDENYQRMVRNSEIPATWPALISMKSDDHNRLWISTIVEDQDVYQWWVLDENGEPLATFTWPRSQTVEDIKNGYVYVRETDDMGLAKVVRYRVDGL